LPEVNRRKLYEKKGFGSIFEFAKKLAGLSEEQVKLTLNLEKRFSSLQILQNLLTNGQVSINKLARVVSIANPENEEFLAGQVQILSKSAVDTLVRDEKWANNESDWHGGFGSGKNKNGLFEPTIEAKSLSGQTLEIGRYGNEERTLNLSSEIHQKLLELQEKGIDVNNLLLDFLRKREDEIAQNKEEISQKVLQKEETKAEKAEIKQNRYIPRDVRKILKEEFGTKCSMKNCQKPATTIHHTQRFSLSGSHNPHYLAPLCKEHHELAHAVDLKCREAKWSRR
ncbi:HNH endonuclease, partial [Candidatus Peregrinibacteria bacterium]|nr:HNH endonuclease [Candidatus Peregrinibacteria bacterium]